MPLPDFTDEEQYLINAVKLSSARGQLNSFMWAYLISTAGLACAGVYYNNVGLAFTAVVGICFFRIYEEVSQSKWGPHWYSIIVKFENALSDRTADLKSGDGPRS